MKILLRCLDGIQKVFWVLALFELGLGQVLAVLLTSGVADGVVFSSAALLLRQARQLGGFGKKRETTDHTQLDKTDQLQ